MDMSQKTKKFKNNSIFYFKTKYKKGSITAIELDSNKNEISRNTLYSAKDSTKLNIYAEDEIKLNHLAFVRLEYTDEDGIIKPLLRGKIKVEVEGGKILAFGNACPYNKDLYFSNESDTYYGRALLIVKVFDDLKIKASSPYGNNELSLKLNK